jgi:hypothetical protein
MVTNPGHIRHCFYYEIIYEFYFYTKTNITIEMIHELKAKYFNSI